MVLDFGHATAGLRPEPLPRFQHIKRRLHSRRRHPFA
jgi:hypothetical protein